jgi:hypothetical protein
VVKRGVLPPYDSFSVATMVVSGNIVFTGHFGGFPDCDGNLLRELEQQIRQCFANLNSALQEIDLGPCGTRSHPGRSLSISLAQFL